jgi:hypothetical protein
MVRQRVRGPLAVMVVDMTISRVPMDTSGRSPDGIRRRMSMAYAVKVTRENPDFLRRC